MERAFKGVWISANIWLSEELTLQEKVFLAEIDSLDNEDGCYASNNYFSKFFGLSRNRCSEIIKSLEKKGLIWIKYIRNSEGKNIEKRVIKVVEKPNTPSRKTDRPSRKVEGGYSGNREENNSLNNNPFNNTSNTMSDSPNQTACDIPFESIVKYLNQKCDTKYRSGTQKTKTLIKARWNEGFRLNDFQEVINKKSAQWLNSDMQKYLRPETLFGTKFEGYLNESGVNQNGSNQRRNGTSTGESYEDVLAAAERDRKAWGG